MAHELTIRANGRAEMAFVGETPWHGLGQSITKGAPITVWEKEAGFDWEARAGVPMANNPDAVADCILFEDYKALYRSDTLAPLAIVGKDYQVVQPRDMLGFFRDLTESGGWHIHTAGTMRGGRKLWVMATCEDPFRFVRGYKGDKVAMNLLLATSLDGSMKTTAMLTTVRVVCANTLRMALEGGGHAEVRLTHRSTFDEDLIKSVLGVDAAHKTFDAFMEQARQMAETPIDLSEARDVLLRLYKPSAAVSKTNVAWLTGNLAELDTQRAEPSDGRAVPRILELFDGDGMGAGLRTAAGTRWGLLNAVTQYVDHEAGRSRDTGLDAAWFGRGRDVKQQALEILTEEA